MLKLAKKRLPEYQCKAVFACRRRLQMDPPLTIDDFAVDFDFDVDDRRPAFALPPKVAEFQLHIDEKVLPRQDECRMGGMLHVAAD